MRSPQDIFTGGQRKLLVWGVVQIMFMAGLVMQAIDGGQFVQGSLVNAGIFGGGNIGEHLGKGIGNIGSK